MTTLLVTAHVGLWVAIVVEGLAICVLLYKNNRLAEMAALGGVEGHLAKGKVGPRFETTDLRTGEVVSQGQLLGMRVSILFVSPSCQDCRRLMAGLAETLAGTERVDGLLASCYGDGQNCSGTFESLSNVPLLEDHEGDLSGPFGIRAWPALVELDAAWRIVGYSYPSLPEHVLQFLPAQSLGIGR